MDPKLRNFTPGCDLLPIDAKNKYESDEKKMIAKHYSIFHKKNFEILMDINPSQIIIRINFLSQSMLGRLRTLFYTHNSLVRGLSLLSLLDNCSIQFSSDMMTMFSESIYLSSEWFVYLYVY
jgi:hypothetical protein